MQVGNGASCGDLNFDKILVDGVDSQQLVSDEIAGHKVCECAPLEFLCF